MSNLNTTKRKIFYRSGAIGDVVHCLPTLKLAKKLNPETSIEFIVGGQQIKELLENYCPYIDRVYCITKEEFAGKAPSTEENVDDFEGLKNSIKENPVEDFIFFHTNWLRAFMWNWKHIRAKSFFVYKKDNKISAVENFAQTYFRESNLGKLKKDLDCKILECHEESKQPPYICIALGVGRHRPHRAYPADLWMEFIKLVLQKTNLNIMLLGGPDELELFGDFIEEISRIDDKGRVQNLIGKTSVSDLVPILASSQSVYSADTGILHIASAIGIPVSSVFAITSELRTGPFTPKANVYRSSSCKCAAEQNLDSLKHCPYSQNGYAACIRDIKPEQLLDPAF